MKTMMMLTSSSAISASGCYVTLCFFVHSPLSLSLSLFLSFPVCSPLFSPLCFLLFSFLSFSSLCYLFLTFPSPFVFFLSSLISFSPLFSPLPGSVPPMAFIAKRRRRFLVTASVHHGGEGCQPRDVLPD